MKTKGYLVAAFGVALWLTTLWCAYRRGVRDGMFYLSPCLSPIAADAEVIKDLRSGNAQDALTKVEGKYYAAADWALAFGWQRRPGSRLGEALDQLVAYRLKYAGPASQWTPCEVELERQLTDRKCGQTKPFDVGMFIPSELGLNYSKNGFGLYTFNDLTLATEF